MAALIIPIIAQSITVSYEILYGSYMIYLSDFVEIFYSYSLYRKWSMQ